MKKIIPLLLCVYGFYANAQTPPKPNTDKPAEKSTTPLPSVSATNTNHWGVSINLTTNGIGAEVSKTLTSNGKLVARAGANYLPYTLKDYIIDFSGTKLKANGDLKFGSIGAYLDWHPFGNSFKITAGAAYIMTKVSLIAFLRDSSKQGDLMLSPSDVGKITMEVKPNPFCPYIGIGFGKAIPKNKVGVSVEIGTYYIGAPDVAFSTTKLLEPTTDQGAVLKNNLKENQWLPKIAINLNIRLTK